jgi:uncharacterized protein (DUF934 family)
MADKQLFLASGRVADEWQNLADDAPLPQAGAIIVSATRWRAERAALIDSGLRLGLRFNSDEPPAEFADDLARFELIALDFPRFGDGRAYSYARLLRQRHAFRGQLRATGNVLADQLFLMRRCGFDAFESDDPRSIAALEQSGPVDVELAYQHAADSRQTISELRKQAATAFAAI